MEFDARTFPSAVAFLASGERDFACVSPDIQMPGTNGLGLQRLVGIWPDPPPVIVVTAHPDRARAAARQSQALQWLEKPIKADQRAARLANVLEILD